MPGAVIEETVGGFPVGHAASQDLRPQAQAAFTGRGMAFKDVHTGSGMGSESARRKVHEGACLARGLETRRILSPWMPVSL